VLGHVAAGTHLLDCSTIDVATARDLAAAAQKAGCPMVDAPVSGGVAGAEKASLTFMVGGPEAAFAAAEPLLNTMGARVVHVGAAGAGQAVKLCNNMLLAISMIGTCEAFQLAESLGVDPQTFFDVVSTSSGQCWSVTSYCPVPGPVPGAPSNRDYEPGFATAMMLKDLRLAQAAGQETGEASPLGALATQLYTLMSADGAGHKDFSAIGGWLKGDIPGNR
jgi:3-hydroxyisobutyrate dehydrogenase